MSPTRRSADTAAGTTYADWRVYGVRSDGRKFAVIYDNRVRGDAGAVRVVSAWPLRGSGRR